MGVTYNKRNQRWLSIINIDSLTVQLGYFIDRLDAAKAYDTYVIQNNLEHPINGV